MEIKRIQNPNKKIIDEISRIHYSVLTESFLNNFGLNFLQIIYTNLLKSKNAILIVSEENDNIIGYALAYSDYSKFFKTAISENFIMIGLIVLGKILQKPKILIKLVSTLFKSNTETEHAELQFIAVTPTNQGKNIGTKLIEKLNIEFGQSNIKNYFVGTKTDNLLSNNFYKKLGFKMIYTKKYFGDQLNFYISPNI